MGKVKNKIDYVILESCNGQIELHRGRGGKKWTGQKGKNLEWTLPIFVENNADEILKDIYNLSHWIPDGKGKECSLDSKELRSAIWQKIFPLISVKDLPKINENASMTAQIRMNKTQSKGRYNDDVDMVSISSDECYTFYHDVETIVNHFGKEYWKNKVVYMNCDDAGQSAFWIYFYNNFEKLQLKQIISTHYDGSKLDYSGALYLFDKWNEKDGFIVKYDGKKIIRIPPIGNISTFNGSYSDKICMDIAINEADVIITNPPFSKFEHYYNCMLSTGKDIICLGSKTAVQYTWTKKLWDNNKIFVLPFRFDWFLTPTFKRKNAVALIFTNIPQNHKTNKIKSLSEIPIKYYDDKGMLVVNNFVPNDYYKPFAISVSPIQNGILNSGYKLLQSMYNPYLNGKKQFTRTIIIKEINEKGKLNSEFDNVKFETLKKNIPKNTSLFD